MQAYALLSQSVTEQKHIRWPVAALAILLLGVLAYAFQTPPIPEIPFFRDVPVAVIAHRGASGHAPENTIPAFEVALEMGSHAIELDLQMSADGHVVVMHDATVDRTTDGSGQVLDMTLEELKALDAGYHFLSPDGVYPYRGKGIRIPTLTEVLERFPTTPLVLDIKTESGKAIVDAVAAVVAHHEAEDRVIAISDTESLRRFRHLIPQAPTSFGESEVLTFFILHLVHLHRWYRPPAELLVVREYHGGIRVVTSRFVRAAERLGLEVHVWTINEIEDMRRLVHLGVDGMLTDYPDRLQSVLMEERFTGMVLTRRRHSERTSTCPRASYLLSRSLRSQR